MSAPTDATRIEFVAVVAQVRTLADGGLRVTLDLPEDAVYEAAWLMELKRSQATARVTIQRET